MRYEKPVMEIIELETSDVIVTSTAGSLNNPLDKDPSNELWTPLL